jgi:hypothetical protein
MGVWFRFVVMACLLWCSGAVAQTSPPDAAEPLPQEAPTTPARVLHPAGPKLTVTVGLYVNALREVDAQKQTFDADLFYWLRYTRRGTELTDEELEEVRFANGEVTSLEIEERKALGNENFVLMRVRATFHFHADFRHYPFDVQELPVRVQHGAFLADQLELKADLRSFQRAGVREDRQGLGNHVQLADMVVTGVRHEIGTHTYRTDFGDYSDPLPSTTYSRYTMTIETRREVTPFFIKIVIPLLIIQILAYLVFFVAADRIDVAVGLTVTSLLASIAFQSALSDSLPDIGYLTTADRIFHLSYFLIMTAMAQMVYQYNVDLQGDKQRVKLIDVIGRVLYPIVFFGGVWLICVWM